MLKLTAEKIAEVAMVGVAKVKKDISKGKLDSDSLVYIVRYIQGHRMLAGGLRVWDGVMGNVAKPTNDTSEKRDVHETDFVNIPKNRIELCENGLFSGTEIVVLRAIEASGKKRKHAEAQVRKMREAVCAERLGEDHLEELGL